MPHNLILEPQAPLPIDRSRYAIRCTNFCTRMQPDSIAIIPSNLECTRSNDTDYLYRQSSDLLYLTGFPEPESVLVLSNIGGVKPQVVMFVRPKDAARETWTGFRAGPEGAKKDYLFGGEGEAFPIDSFGAKITELLAQAKNVYYKEGNNPAVDTIFSAAYMPMQKTKINYELILHDMRMIKSADELALMRRAAAISAMAHCHTMRYCSAQIARRGELREYELQAELEHIFTMNGGTTAYPSIVAAGANACTLHYTSNRDLIADGHLILIDAACEYQYYASDITRTFPANGKFSPAQRKLYQAVLNAQLAAIKVVKPGATIAQVHQTAIDVLLKELFALGLMPKDLENQPDKAIEWLKKHLYMHGTSHWLGLDVHDVCVDADGNMLNRARNRPFQAGMLITVEPGVYIRPEYETASDIRGIGIRIEDDVLVTAGGCEVISAGVPKDPYDIEALMAEGRV